MMWSKGGAREVITTWTQLFSGACTREIPAGTMLFREGDFARDVFLLVEGLLLLTRSPIPGSEEVLGLRVPGQIVEDCAHALSMPYSVSARAITYVTVARISVGDLQHKRMSNPNVGLLFERAVSQDLYVAAAFISQLKQWSPVERLEGFLRFLASVTDHQHRDEGSYVVRRPLLDEEIASILGISSRQLKRVKKQMYDDGCLQFTGRKTWVLTSKHSVGRWGSMEQRID
jgi:CRP-like cAMP-binding protein